MSAGEELDLDVARANVRLQEALDRWNSGIHDDCCESLSLTAQCLDRVRRAIENGVTPANPTRDKIELIQQEIRLFARKADASAAFWRGLAVFASAEPSQPDVKDTGWQGVA